MKNVKEYYKILGQVVYAVAIADGSVQQEEREKLHQFVLKELANKEKTYDSSGMNQAFYVDFEFDVSEKMHQDLTGSLDKLVRFLEINFEPQDKELLKRSLSLMEAVANAYSKKNEKTIIEKFMINTGSYLKT